MLFISLTLSRLPNRKQPNRLGGKEVSYAHPDEKIVIRSGSRLKERSRVGL
jgi:hypothetical protein